MAKKANVPEIGNENASSEENAPVVKKERKTRKAPEPKEAKAGTPVYYMSNNTISQATIVEKKDVYVWEAGENPSSVTTSYSVGTKDGGIIGTYAKNEIFTSKEALKKTL